MKKKIASTLIPVLIAVLAAAPVPLSAQQNPTRGLTVPFSAPGAVNGNNVNVTGTFTITRFANLDGGLAAVGTLMATVPDVNGVRTVITQLTLPVTSITAGEESSSVIAQQVACEILHLELGPLDLDLLGLVVHLDQIVLDISAEPGAGNLLGNLLCAIAGLLDSGPLEQILTQLVGLLNRLLGAL